MSGITRLSRPTRSWVAARWTVLAVTVGLIVSFWTAPEASLSVLWYVLVPILPAVFLINVELWRNVCPLATLNVLTGSRVGARTLSWEGARRASVVGVVLLLVMVPGRRFLFNVHASALGATVIAVCVLAVVGGLVFAMKAGFCTSICPVLPVERLYGRYPLVGTPNARCIPCTNCSKACLDLMPERSAEALASGPEGERGWTTTAYGAFALAFPGFVVAYYLLADTTWAEAPTVYGVSAAGMVASWIVLATAFRVGAVSRRTALTVCGALAAGLYYWFAPIGIRDVFGLPAPFVWMARAAALVLVAAWMVRGLGSASWGHGAAVTPPDERASRGRSPDALQGGGDRPPE